MACKQIVMRLYRFCDVIYMKNHYVFDIVLNHETYSKKVLLRWRTEVFYEIRLHIYAWVLYFTDEAGK